MSAEGYTAETLAHLAAPRNVGTLAAPDGTGTDRNPGCGDTTTITLRVTGDRIGEARFRTFGCTAAIAAASALTERVTGRTLDDALALEPAELVHALGGLPERKAACAAMAVGALRAAVRDARARAAR